VRLLILIFPSLFSKTVSEWIYTDSALREIFLHFVWVCKYRRRILNPGACGDLRKILPKLLTNKQ